MARLNGECLNKIRIMFLLYSVDNYIYFIQEYRKFEQLKIKCCTSKIKIIFSHDDNLAEILIKKWKEMGNDFTRFFLNLNTSNQKAILEYLKIPITGKKTLSETENFDSSYYDDCALLPDGLEDINQLLFYFNNRALNQTISNVELPCLPEEIKKNIGNGSNWADYIISLPYDKQIFVLLIIVLQN